MGRPNSNGLVELVDEKTNDKGFFCMDLVSFLFSDKEADFMRRGHKQRMGNVLIVTAAKGINGQWQG